MHRTAYIFVRLWRFEFWPVMLMVVGPAIHQSAITASPITVPASRLGMMTRRALEQFTTTARIMGWKRVGVVDLFPAPTVIEPPPRRRPLHVAIEECGEFYSLQSYITTKHGYMLAPKRITLARHCSDRVLGRAVRHSAVRSLVTTVVRAICYAPLSIAEAIPRRRDREKRHEWVPPAGRG